MHDQAAKKGIKMERSIGVKAAKRKHDQSHDQKYSDPIEHSANYEMRFEKVKPHAGEAVDSRS